MDLVASRMVFLLVVLVLRIFSAGFVCWSTFGVSDLYGQCTCPYSLRTLSVVVIFHVRLCPYVLFVDRSVLLRTTTGLPVSSLIKISNFVSLSIISVLSCHFVCLCLYSLPTRDTYKKYLHFLIGRLGRICGNPDHDQLGHGWSNQPGDGEKWEKDFLSLRRCSFFRQDLRRWTASSGEGAN